jgi:hypothetical protein
MMMVVVAVGGWKVEVDGGWALGMAWRRIQAGRGHVGDDCLGKGTRAHIPRGGFGGGPW